MVWLYIISYLRKFCDENKIDATFVHSQCYDPAII